MKPLIHSTIQSFCSEPVCGCIYYNVFYAVGKMTYHKTSFSYYGLYRHTQENPSAVFSFATWQIFMVQVKPRKSASNPLRIFSDL